MSLISIRNSTHNTPLFRIILWVAAVALVIGFGFSNFGSMMQNHGPEPVNTPKSDDVIATVNGEPVTRGQYNQALEQGQQMAQMQGNAGSMNGPLPSGEAHVQALNQAIGQALVLQIAKKKGLTVSDAEMTAERNKALVQMRQTLGLTPTASESEIESKLAANGMSLTTLIPDERIRAAALSEKYNAMLTKLSTPSDADVDQYYTSLHTQHILISNKTRPDAQALDQAKKIIDQLNKGGDFAALAKQYSDDPGEKTKGDDDGFVNGQTGYVDEFMNAARALKPGTVTQAPVLSPQFGYFVIKLVAVKDDKPKDFVKNKAQYVKQIADMKAEKTRSADMDAAQKSMTVVVKDPHLNGDYQMLQAFRTAGAGGAKPSAAAFAPALAAYDKALKSNKDNSEIAQMQAQRSIIFRMTDKPDDQLKALEAAQAAAGGIDPDLALQIGDIYEKKGQMDKALADYDIASKNSFDNVGVHMQLQQTYKDMKQAALADKEAKWVADYNARNKSAQGGMSLGGGPITVAPH